MGCCEPSAYLEKTTNYSDKAENYINKNTNYNEKSANVNNYIDKSNGFVEKTHESCIEKIGSYTEKFHLLENTHPNFVDPKNTNTTNHSSGGGYLDSKSPGSPSDHKRFTVSHLLDLPELVRIPHPPSALYNPLQQHQDFHSILEDRESLNLQGYQNSHLYQTTGRTSNSSNSAMGNTQHNPSSVHNTSTPANHKLDQLHHQQTMQNHSNSQQKQQQQNNHHQQYQKQQLSPGQQKSTSLSLKDKQIVRGDRSPLSPHDTDRSDGEYIFYFLII